MPRRHSGALRRLIVALCLATAVGLSQVNWVVASDIAPAPTTEKQGRVLPDTEGEITEILLHYDPVCAREIAPLYRDLFRMLEPQIRLKVVCPSKAATSVFFRDWGVAAASGGRDVRIVNVNLPVSVWARDRCIVRQGLDPRDPASCFVPARMREYEIEKDNDRRAQIILWAASLGPQPMMSTLHLEGGNVVANGEQVFVGANVVAENYPAFTPEELDAELRRICGPDLVLVRDRTGGSPWCHVDMYLTPIDDTTVFVGSTDLAEAILADADSERRRVEQMLEGDAPDGCSLGEQLDDVAEQMCSLGYTVHRLPVVAHHTDDWMITYNNVLIDRRGYRRIVYMPIYHIRSLDSTAAAIYRSSGFEVRMIDVSLVHKYGGAIRCVANVTQRNLSGASFPVEHLPAARPTQPHTTVPVAREKQPLHKASPQSSTRS